VTTKFAFRAATALKPKDASTVRAPAMAPKVRPRPCSRASGFLTKDTPPERLADAVRAVAAGETLRRRRSRADWSRPSPASLHPVRRTPQRLSALTARELEVLREIARGDTNAQIAGRLFLSEATVKTHVTRILAKLDLPDRVHAVVLAYECGLVPPGQAAG
jgi:DNA-binding NarL/FixJ family response regulator